MPCAGEREALRYRMHKCGWRGETLHGGMFALVFGVGEQRLDKADRIAEHGYVVRVYRTAVSNELVADFQVLPIESVAEQAHGVSIIGLLKEAIAVPFVPSIWTFAPSKVQGRGSASRLRGPIMSRLTPEEIERYKRHLVMRDVGGLGQQKLKQSRVLVVGAGGLGSPVLMYLAAAGVGTLGIADDDTVSLSNLQRQILHRSETVGTKKTASAVQSITAINPHVAVEVHDGRVHSGNAIDLIRRYDLVVDGSDNFATRYLVSDACYLAERTLVFGAVGPFDGYVSTFKPYQSGSDGHPLPSYRCVFPEAPPDGLVPNCSEVGVLGAVVGVIGTLQATEVLKELLGIGESLAGHLLLYDALSARFDKFRVAWNPDNPLNGRAPVIRDLSQHTQRVT